MTAGAAPSEPQEAAVIAKALYAAALMATGYGKPKTAEATREAKVALDALVARLAEAERERDEARQAESLIRAFEDNLHMRLNDAESRVAALTEALREIAAIKPDGLWSAQEPRRVKAVKIANDALAAAGEPEAATP